MDRPHLEASFVKSSTTLNQCPPPDLPEYAFVGRSNVGKSSLINMLTGRKELAKTSGKPGKTQLINHFAIRLASESKPSWYLVDLPGYGYAKVSKAQRSEFQQLIYPYLKKRPSLMCLFVLIDSRHEPQQIDIDFMAYLGINSIPFAMIFTKTDKLKVGGISSKIESYNKKMLEQWEVLPPQFFSSSQKGTGRDEILDYILNTNQLFDSH